MASLAMKSMQSLRRAHTGLLDVNFGTRSSLRGDLVLHPFGEVRIRYDSFMLFFIVFSAVLEPFVVCFDVFLDSPWFELNRLVDAIFILDLFVNFNTGIESDGQVILDRRQIANKYLRGWFLFDLLASIPIDLIFLWTVGGEKSTTAKYFRAFKLLKIARLLRLLRLGRIFERLEEALVLKGSVVSIIKFAILASLTCHWICCIFHVAALNTMYEDRESWVDDHGLRDDGNGMRYVFALYFAASTVTTIGYGDVRGISTEELVCQVFATIAGSCILATLITVIMSLVKELNASQMRFKRKMDLINTFLKAKDLPLPLQRRVREYFMFLKRYQLGRDDMEDEKYLMSELSSKLRQEVALHINAGIVRHAPVFQGADESFVADVCGEMQRRYFSPGEVVLQENSIGDSMYILANGTVDVLKGGVKVATLSEGSVFGEMALLGISNKRTATIKTVTFCDLRVIQRGTFQQLLRKFPNEAARLEAEGRRRLRELQMLDSNKEKEKDKSLPGSPQYSRSCTFGMKQSGSRTPPLHPSTPTRSPKRHVTDPLESPKRQQQQVEETRGISHEDQQQQPQQQPQTPEFPRMGWPDRAGEEEEAPEGAETLTTMASVALHSHSVAPAHLQLPPLPARHAVSQTASRLPNPTRQPYDGEHGLPAAKFRATLAELTLRQLVYVQKRVATEVIRRRLQHRHSSYASELGDSTPQMGSPSVGLHQSGANVLESDSSEGGERGRGVRWLSDGDDDAGNADLLEPPGVVQGDD
ncbi:unnamed protein product [Vitrella brassicaformis CCMP3155]|uniref:Cyclic nucleotide-binding domain-containing protein n=3 Tax=Vitrella brassicaformis TaxID=1169539 RepID=A0A0G4G8J6_VITBC|nr:unnamed protein product [Vitrella brassicaformis CCMP3155]|eukprot:CEM24679.1 unnamed protein product [Vitrella brassicaformis CCMP3155]